jgi:hypothetical protein
VEGVNVQGDSGNCSGETDEKRTPVNKTCAFSATSGKPGRADQVEGANAADDVALLGFQVLLHRWTRFADGRCIMTQDGTKQYKAWVELAGKASKETDPEKPMRIIEALCRALDERETVPAGARIRPTRSADS